MHSVRAPSRAGGTSAEGSLLGPGASANSQLLERLRAERLGGGGPRDAEDRQREGAAPAVSGGECCPGTLEEKENEVHWGRFEGRMAGTQPLPARASREQYSGEKQEEEGRDELSREWRGRREAVEEIAEKGVPECSVKKSSSVGVSVGLDRGVTKGGEDEAGEKKAGELNGVHVGSTAVGGRTSAARSHRGPSELRAVDSGNRGGHGETVKGADIAETVTRDGREEGYSAEEEEKATRSGADVGDGAEAGRKQLCGAACV